jgi:hypothetical protein
VKKIITLCVEFTLASASISTSIYTSEFFFSPALLAIKKGLYAREKDVINFIQKALRSKEKITKKL